MTGCRLPNETDQLYVTDGGIETDLIYRREIELPEFAAFPLLESRTGRTALGAYYQDYVRIARASRSRLLLESPTWRSSPDWGGRLGYSIEDLARVNELAVTFLIEIRERADLVGTLVSGTVGPRDDSYPPKEDARQDAANYHRAQLAAFSTAGADLATAHTMTHVGEAAGIVDAARQLDLPIAISFTVETDGRLSDGMSLADAISEMDETAPPDYFLVNCAHPDHIERALTPAGTWCDRIVGTRANASTRSHAELDEANELDDGEPAEFAAAHRRLKELLPNLSILGGCCGTDARHVAALFDVPESEWIDH